MVAGSGGAAGQLVVFDAALELGAEVADQALDRPGRAITERADRVTLDLLGDVLQKIDLGDYRRPIINRLMVRAENIRLAGFDLCFETWADSKVYDAAASWIAVGE